MDACPICSGDDLDVQGAYRGAHSTFEGLKRTCCSSCGMVFANPMPGEADLEQYNSSYFSSAHGEQPSSASAVAFFSGIARLRLAHVQRYLGTKGITVSRLLELGPGPGFFARAWLEKFPETEYLATETDVTCHAPLKALGVELIKGQTCPLGARSVDFVVMSHVLEHVSNPAGFLAEATRNLREGGALFIEVPCKDHEHKSIDEPHLLFFDKAPMHLLLHQAGFEDIELSYYGVPIGQLQSSSRLRGLLMALRARLISMGVVTPFARVRPGLEALNAFERAMVAPFNAHRESRSPAWWLRAVAIKRGGNSDNRFQ